MSESEPPVNGRAKLLMLAGIAFVPLILAYFLYFFFPSLAPTGMTNQGTLISPPVAMQSLGRFAEGSWVLLHRADTSCGPVCRESLILTRQTWKALGKESSRVRRVFVWSIEPNVEASDYLKKEHPRLRLLVDPDVGKELDRVSGDQKGSVFLVDPNGNLMMLYPSEKLGKPMLKDMKHLLKLSNIG